MHRLVIAGAFAASTASALLACGSGRTYPVPAAPEAAVRGFLDAVAANSLVALGELWGTSDGPAASYMDRDELEKRLTVIRAYLVHEEYEILPPGDAILDAPPGERIVQVRLSRHGCTPVIPFTLVQYRSGWLVKDVALEAAGNPMRRCNAGGQPAATRPPR